MAKSLSSSVLPARLYKYREPDNRLHIISLSEASVYLAKPSEFNDLLEARSPIRWDKYTLEDCLRENQKLVDIYHKDKSRSERREIARKITKQKSLWHPSKLKYDPVEEFDKWDSIIGILCLSEDPLSASMWAHYSKVHTGFVIGYDASLLAELPVFDFIDSVEYCDPLPIIYGQDSNDEKFRKKFFMKHQTWAAEVEWRITKNHIDTRVVKLPKQCVTDIIVGANATIGLTNDLVRVRDRHFPNLKIKKVMIDINSLKLSFDDASEL